MVVNKNKPVYLEADLVLHEETAARKEAASSVILLPGDGDKQPDLLYFSAIFVSSGENLNHAYFLPTELLNAEGTIINKALDVEHNESEVIGHIYERAFMDKAGNKLELADLQSEKALDGKEMHVAIAGIIYKNRFPNMAQEVADGKWKVSMEAYYSDFDVKVGDLIISKQEAEALGLASSEEGVFGKMTNVIKNGVKIAEGALTRVLRGIVFSGCGVVKNPANPPSVILETAKNKEGTTEEGEIIIFDYDKLEQSNEDIDNNVTSITVETEKEESELVYKDSIGICVNFKKRVLDATIEGPDAKIIHEDWCTLYDTGCTSFSRDTTDPKCLRNKEIKQTATAYVNKLVAEKEADDKRNKLTKDLDLVLKKADEILKN